MAAISLLLGHLAPNDPCFDPNLNNFAQNGCYLPFAWPFGSKWSLFWSKLEQFGSKWLPFSFYLVIWLQMILVCSLFQSRPDQLCSKWLPFPLSGSFDYQLLKMAANSWLLGRWLLKMASNLLILSLLAPHATCSSPDLISCAQNGCHLKYFCKAIWFQTLLSVAQI